MVEIANVDLRIERYIQFLLTTNLLGKILITPILYEGYFPLIDLSIGSSLLSGCLVRYGCRHKAVTQHFPEFNYSL